MTSTASDDKRPAADPAEDNAFFPSPYSLSQFTAPKSDLSGIDYPNPYRGKKNKILLIGADERYLLMDNGTMFSTGNHPIETLLPMIHLNAAGFDFDIATLSGNPVKFELWALPKQDEAVMAAYRKYLPQIKKPLKLSDVIEQRLGDNSNYAAVFIPGGHGALIGLPKSAEVKAVLSWFMGKGRHVISLCHGPGALLAAGLGETKDSFLFSGYKMTAFPDALDDQTPGIGYMPGRIPWRFGEELQKLGVEIVNSGIDGATYRDRKVLTGDSPLAANNLGKLAAKTLLDDLQGA